MNDQRFPPPPRTPSLEEALPLLDTRPTPVVPASWPEDQATGAASVPAPETTAAIVSQGTISLIPSSATASERAFWEAAPQYSVPPARLVTDPPLRQPSRLRTWLSRLLFVAIVAVALALLYYEASIAYRVPWQRPELLLARRRAE